MANLTITAASVLAASTASKASATAGETITAGQPVYLHTDGKYYRADTDTAAHAAVVGIALHASLASQPLQIITSGALTLGAILTKGTVILLSNSVGIMYEIIDTVGPDDVMVAADYRTVIGTSTSTTVLNVAITASGVNQA
jgi:hypothetical protein